MTIADWLIVLTVVTSVVIGLFRGFVVEVMALVVWALALLAALMAALSDPANGLVLLPLSPTLVTTNWVRSSMLDS